MERCSASSLETMCLALWGCWHTPCSYASRKLETLSVFSRSHRTQRRMIRAGKVEAISLQHSGQHSRDGLIAHIARATINRVRTLSTASGAVVWWLAFCLTFYRFIAIHVRPECFRNCHRAVGLLIILDQRKP